jgi:hypothetical protein
MMNLFSSCWSEIMTKFWENKQNKKRAIFRKIARFEYSINELEFIV